MTCAFHCFPGENKINEMEISDGTFLFALLCAWIFATVTCDINTVAKDRSSAEDAVLEFDDPIAWTRGAQRKRCWGYEKDCSESQQMFRNTPCIRSQQNDYDRRRHDFWRYGDWGYVAHYKNSMQDICTQRAASDSLLRCSTENTMCIARNLFIDLRQLNHTQHSNSYRTDVFAKKGMLGGRCKMHEDRLPKGKQPDVLMTWVDELKMYDGLKFKPQPNAKQCDVWIEKPTIIMKFDSGVNLYHHFCDFFNLYATQHVNGSFTRDVNILMWNTGGMGYHDMFKAVWAAFTHAGDFTLLTRYDGQRVCFRDAVFSLNPRMGLGLFYSTPIPVKCSGSGLFKAFHRHMVHRLNLTDTREHLGTPGYKLRVKFMSRKTRWRRVLNEDELISALKDTGKYDVERVEYTYEMPLLEQFQKSYDADVLIGMHGAGLTHSLFLPDWGSLFELYNCEDERCYRDLAALRGAHYVTWRDKSKLEVVESSPQHANSAVEKFSNYRMDTAEFLKLVEEAAVAVRRRLPKPRTKDEL